MSNSKVKTQVRSEQKVRKIAGLPQAENGVGRRSDGLVSFYATADLPTNAPNGTLAYDTTANELKIRKAGVWTAV